MVITPCLSGHWSKKQAKKFLKPVCPVYSKIQETWEKSKENRIVFIGFILALCVIWSKSIVANEAFLLLFPMQNRRVLNTVSRGRTQIKHHVISQLLSLM